MYLEGFVLLAIFCYIENAPRISTTSINSNDMYKNDASISKEAGANSSDAFTDGASITKEASTNPEDIYNDDASFTKNASTNSSKVYNDGASITDEASGNSSDAFTDGASITEEASTNSGDLYDDDASITKEASTNSNKVYKDDASITTEGKTHSSNRHKFGFSSSHNFASLPARNENYPIHTPFMTLPECVAHLEAVTTNSMPMIELYAPEYYIVSTECVTYFCRDSQSFIDGVCEPIFTYKVREKYVMF